MSRKFFKLLRFRKLQYSANVRDKIINKAAHPRIDSLNIELKFWASVLDSRLFLPLFEKRIDSEARQVAISVSENQLLRLLVKDGPSISRVIVVKENEKKGNQKWA